MEACQSCDGTGLRSTASPSEMFRGQRSEWGARKLRGARPPRSMQCQTPAPRTPRAKRAREHSQRLRCVRCGGARLDRRYAQGGRCERARDGHRIRRSTQGLASAPWRWRNSLPKHARVIARWPRASICGCEGRRATGMPGLLMAGRNIRVVRHNVMRPRARWPVRGRWPVRSGTFSRWSRGRRWWVKASTRTTAELTTGAAHAPARASTCAPVVCARLCAGPPYG